MKSAYASMVEFMDRYFRDYNRYGGDPRTLPRMLKYYLPEIELHSFTLNAQRPFGLERILWAMTHPGLHEEFSVNYYVVDPRRLAVVVQIKNQFSEEASGKSYPPKELSVHYYLVKDPETAYKIKKILFFVEVRSAEEVKVVEVIRKFQAGVKPVAIKG